AFVGCACGSTGQPGRHRGNGGNREYAPGKSTEAVADRGTITHQILLERLITSLDDARSEYGFSEGFSERLLAPKPSGAHAIILAPRFWQKNRFPRPKTRLDHKPAPLCHRAGRRGAVDLPL